MNASSSFFIIPSDIIETATAFVLERTGVKLAEDRLQNLYKRVHDRRLVMKHFVQKHPDVKISTTFDASKKWVLDQEFPLTRPDNRQFRNAYSKGISKVGSEFARRKEREKTLGLKRPERERIADLITLDKDRRQYKFIL